MGQRKRTSSATNEHRKILVGVRVPESFHKRIQAECLKREISLQELIISALKRFFRNPVEYDYEVATFVRHDSELTDAEVDERNAALAMWVKYIDKMPREKRQIMTWAMEWDLRTLKSSRRKSAPRLRLRERPSRKSERRRRRYAKA